MDEKDLQDILLDILRCSLKGERNVPELNEKLKPDVILSVYKLANKHSLAHLVSRYVFAHQLPVPQELAQRFQQVDVRCVLNHEKMKLAYQQICDAFEEARIDYIPLKGSVLREHYPDESMRTSCDIDILVREEELNRAVAVLEQKQFQVGERIFHDVSLFAPNGIHLELHFSLCEKMDRLDAVLKNAWNHAVLEQGSRYAFKDAFFLFHQFSHMAYHFQSGGCGIRSLMDIWVMEHHMKLTYSCAEKLLKKAGIYQFAVEMTKLANRCFSERNVSDPVLDYIWRGGVYGIKQNEVMVKKTQSGGFLAYLRKRILKPYTTMTITYPILEKLPILLPFCWVHRWIKAIILGKTRNVMSEFAFSHRVSDEEDREIAEICRRLGL